MPILVASIKPLNKTPVERGTAPKPTSRPFQDAVSTPIAAAVSTAGVAIQGL